ncbi:Hypothetical predicted protein [Octopus vulgaris]|uniref:Uncharacterized protein n=1 Tax=Octopus vulgaris TaxID=6645 RepID=A0AA36BNJ6_OCTVU|nr:Hypothetical predicted protein [Octopus vulgaris]
MIYFRATVPNKYERSTIRLTGRGLSFCATNSGDATALGWHIGSSGNGNGVRASSSNSHHRGFALDFCIGGSGDGYGGILLDIIHCFNKFVITVDVVDVVAVVEIYCGSSGCGCGGDNSALDLAGF